MDTRSLTVRHWGIAALAISTALGVGGLVLLVATPRPKIPLGSRPEETVGYIAMQLTFAVVAALLMWRRPDNRIGWALAGVALMSSVEFATSGYGLYALYGRPALPFAELALWVYSWAGILLALFGGWIVFTFPGGRLSTRREAAGVGVLALGSVLVIASLMLRPGPLIYLPGVVNPIGQPAFARWLELAGVAGAALFALALVLGILTIRERYVAARGAERQQIKWFLGGLVLLGVVMIPLLPFVLELAGDPIARYLARVATALALAALPVTIGIAILRFRLYDIDLLINRAIVYAVLSAALGAVYVAGVIGTQALLGAFTGGNEIAVATTTLVVVALFQPLRRWIQSAVDRRFYRSRYDAARTLDAFSARLRDEVDIETVRRDVLEVVEATLRPAHATMWLRASVGAHPRSR